MILIVCWAPATFDRVYTWINGDTEYYILAIHVFSTRIQGFAHAIAYGKSRVKKIRESWSQRNDNGPLASLVRIQKPSVSDSFSNT